MKKIRCISIEVIGVTLFALGVHLFVASNQIVPGGVTGLATIINFLWGIPIGLCSFLINLPLFVLGYIFLGKKTVIRTGITVVFLSFLLDVGVAWLPSYEGNIFVASIFGGGLMGCGLSLILLSNTTTGGGDLLGRLIQIKYSQISMGKILLAIDCIVIGLSMLVFGNIIYGLCGVLTMCVSSCIIDWVYQPKMETELTV